MGWFCSITYFCADRILKMDATTAGLIKFIVSEKMLLFDFPIGCYIYVKAMPCCEYHLWVPIKQIRTHLVKNHDRNIPSNHISCFWFFFLIFSYSPMLESFRVNPTHDVLYSIQQYDCVIEFVSDLRHISDFLQVLLFPLP
jgi:hypothetical protein